MQSSTAAVSLKVFQGLSTCLLTVGLFTDLTLELVKNFLTALLGLHLESQRGLKKKIAEVSLF